MGNGKRSTGSAIALAIFALTLTLLITSMCATAQTETVLYSFTGCGVGCDGPASAPSGGVVFDSAGNMYGPTVFGGTAGDGTVFEVSPASGGGWTESVLYSFSDKKYTIGYGPAVSLTIDAAGNLYGTRNNQGAYGNGLVFEVSPVAGGGWTEKTIHSFNGKNAGGGPEGGLLIDAAGNLYGTTESGGEYGYGTVFELSPVTGGWSEKVLHSFKRGCCDGAGPTFTSLVMDGAGNIYGTTTNGGGHISTACPYGCGVVFELSPATGGRWTEKLLHSFAEDGTDGLFPESGVTLDASGNLFGTTFKGGTGPCNTDRVPGCGTVFEVSPASGGGWTETIIHQFQDNSTDGGFPQNGDGLTVDSAGNVYGVTPFGGPYLDGGTVFKLSPAGGGAWTQTILHFFENNGTDGLGPSGPLVFDAAGNLYGTTGGGGNGGGSGGTVYEITP